MRISIFAIAIILMTTLFSCANNSSAEASDDEWQNPAVENLDEEEVREIQTDTERTEPLMEAAEERNVTDPDDEDEPE